MNQLNSVFNHFRVTCVSSYYQAARDYYGDVCHWLISLLDLFKKTVPDNMFYC